MKTINVENFINSLDAKEQEEYKSDIAELKERIWYRVMLEPRLTLSKGQPNSNQRNL